MADKSSPEYAMLPAGTIVKWGATGEDVADFQSLVNCKALGATGATGSFVDCTTLIDTQKQFLSDMPEGPEKSLGFVDDPSNTSFMAFLNAAQARQTVQFYIKLPNGRTATMIMALSGWQLNEITAPAGEVIQITVNGKQNNIDWGYDEPGSLFDGMTDSLATFAITGKGSFRTFTTSVLSDLAKIASRIALSSALQSIFGVASSAFTGGATGGSTPSGAYNNAAGDVKFNAKGGVYDSPSLSSFSNGVYDSPQLFAFAQGAGVFGEAGPEAIMPLTRASDGSLGVRSVGGGGAQSSGSAPVVYITIEGDGNTGTQTTAGWEQFGKEIGSFVDQRYRKMIQSDLRPGGAIWNSTKGTR